MPRGPGGAAPRPHEPYRRYVLQMVMDGVTERNFGTWTNPAVAAEAKRGFYRTVNGGAGLVRRHGFPYRVSVQVTEHIRTIPISYGVNVQLHKQGTLRSRRRLRQLRKKGY